MRADVLDGIQAACLDCLQVNLAVLADWHHGTGTHLRLGAGLCFRPAFSTGLPTVEAGLAKRMEQARNLLGLKVIQWHDQVPADALAGLLADGHTRYLVGDAYHLPWVPYFGQRHMKHSFLATLGADGVLIVDGYHNDTPWGPARPGRWRLTASELADALAGSFTTAIHVVPVPLTGVDADAGIEPPDADAVARYITAFRTWADRHAALDRLTLETWLLARDRLLFATGSGEPGHAEHAAAWKRLAEKTYIAFRRVELGRREPPGILDDLAALLLTEASLEADGLGTAPEAEGNASPAPGTRAERAGPEAGYLRGQVGRAVLDAVGHVLGITPDNVVAAGPLAEIPGFSSFSLVQVLERIEHTLGVEVPPEGLAPESLADVASLCELFVHCMTRMPASA